MPTIEDVTYKVDQQLFQNKIIVRYMKKSAKKMYKGESNFIRPRKAHGMWTQPNGHISNSVFRIGDFREDMAVALPLESYHQANPESRRQKNQETTNTKNVPKIILKNFESYCEKSTLHGLRYVGDTSLSFIERLFWVAAFCLAFTFACYYITKIFEKWDTNPVIVAFNPTDATFNEIPFPSVTICNMNQVKKSEAEKIFQEQSLAEMQLVEDVCNFNTNSSNEQRQLPVWKEVQHFLIRVGQSCTDTVKACFWQNDNMSCEEFFNNDLTDEGLCCSFNRLPAEYIFRNPKDFSFLNHTHPKQTYDWSPEKGFTSPNNGDLSIIPIRPSGSGTHLGLSVIVDAQVDNYYCSSTNSFGFKIILSNPIETPKIADYGFLLSPGVEARFVVRPQIREATPTLRSVDVEKRQCFFEDERPLQYFRSYTSRNCRLECQSNHTYMMCECIPYYLPKSTDILVCGKRHELCVSQAKEDMELVYGNGSSCNCLPGCYEMNFDKSATYSRLTTPSSKYRWDNISDEYFRKNIAILHFFFKDNRFQRQTKSEIYGFTEVLSNVGGLLGLCLGFSFLSLVEIVYFLTLKLCCGYLHARKREKKNGNKKERYGNSVLPFMS